jgi:predicted naringenin-chalcone synthase
VARAFVAADPRAVVLICCVELCTLHYQYGWDPEQIVANALFADGAGACVIQADPLSVSPPHGQNQHTHAHSISKIIASGSMMLPDSTDAMTWRVGDHGFRMTLSSSVPGILAEHLRPWLGAWLANYDLTIEQIATWAVHPGGPRILNAFAEAVSIPRESLSVSREIMQTHGNMSSPTVLFVIDRLRELNRPGPCVAIGFGPGLVAEATLLG